MPKKKVLYLITKSNWGGAQRYVFDLATNLDRAKYEPVVALGGDGELKEKLEAAGIRTTALQSLQRDISISKELAFARELWQTLQAEKPEVLHVNSSKAGGVGCLLGRLSFVPRVIFTAHGWAFNEARPAWQKLVVKFLHWVTVLLSHQTIAVSNGMKRQLRWPLAAGRMVVINPGRTVEGLLGREEARAKIVDFCPRLSHHASDPWLVMVAELHPVKQHTVLFEAIETLTRQFPAWRLVCVGGGALHETLEQDITARGLTDHIFLTGAIFEAGLYIKAADCLVLPSRSEAFVYVLLEAGAAQLPVVASNVGGIPDIIVDGETGVLVPAGDQESLAAAIADVLANDTKRQTLAAAHHKRSATFSVTNMVEQTVALYQSDKS